MDATCAIQDSIHVIGLVHKYVSRILGTYHNGKPPLIMRYYNLTVSPPFTSTIVSLLTASHTDFTDGL